MHTSICVKAEMCNCCAFRLVYHWSMIEYLLKNFSDLIFQSIFCTGEEFLHCWNEVYLWLFNGSAAHSYFLCYNRIGYLAFGALLPFIWHKTQCKIFSMLRSTALNLTRGCYFVNVHVDQVHFSNTLLKLPHYCLSDSSCLMPTFDFVIQQYLRQCSVRLVRTAGTLYFVIKFAAAREASVIKINQEPSCAACYITKVRVKNY